MCLHHYFVLWSREGLLGIFFLRGKTFNNLSKNLIYLKINVNHSVIIHLQVKVNFIDVECIIFVLLKLRKIKVTINKQHCDL